MCETVQIAVCVKASPAGTGPKIREFAVAVKNPDRVPTLAMAGIWDLRVPP